MNLRIDPKAPLGRRLGARIFEDLLCFLTVVFLAQCRCAVAEVAITGELKQWHKITLTWDGPFARETNDAPNPFLDCRMTVTFTHESGSPSYVVPGYFAADGRAGQSSADSGNQWRAHLAPDKPGSWRFQVNFQSGKNLAADDEAARLAPTKVIDTGSFEVAPTDKTGRDFRGQGRLEYVGRRYLRFAGTGEYFLKAGADAPENLLAYADFDGTYSAKSAGTTRTGEATTTPLKTWQPHVGDWHTGDPIWKAGKGKGLIGALNYLAGKGANAFSFLTYNAGGDGDDVWPFVSRNDKLHYDCSKLDQWQMVFDHAQQLGLYLHFKLQETEMDDNRNGNITNVPTSLDGGDLGIERKLYLRELIARFGYELALNWNLGEENTQSTEQQRAMSQYLHDTDPYPHHIVVHTFPEWQDRVYPPLLGSQSALTGASLQNGWWVDHQRVLHWVRESEKAGKPWVVANDEQNPADYGVPPDPGYEGGNGRGTVSNPNRSYDLNDIRKYALWGTLMAGGGGVEYYFGYRFPQNDLGCEDWRSRDRSWDYCRVALDFFRRNKIPFWEMQCADALAGNPENDNSKYCLARPGKVYVVYLPNGGSTEVDLETNATPFRVQWFDPRAGGPMQAGPVREVQGPGKVSLGPPPSDAAEDWVVVVGN
jgi:Domain of unknown function (DUF5060)/Putative collagen-binding domain of a collagenase